MVYRSKGGFPEHEPAPVRASEDTALAEQREVLALRIAELDPHAAGPVRDGDEGYYAQFMIDEVPVLLVTQLRRRGPLDRAIARYEVELTIAVQRDVPLLLMSPVGLLETLAISLRLEQDIRLEHPAFDKAFQVKGDPALAHRILTAPVREDLLNVLSLGPTLRILDGFARFTLTGEGDTALRLEHACVHSSAITLLQHVHRELA